MKKFSFLFVFFLFVSACAPASPLEGSGGADPVDESEEPVMPAPAIEEEEPPTEAPAMPVATTRPEFPATSPTLMGSPPESPYTAEMLSPIFYGSFHDFILLGATSHGTWLQASDVYSLLQTEATYDFYFQGEYIGAGTARVVPLENQGPPGTCEYYSVDQNISGGGPPSFGLKQGQPASIRPVEDIAVDSPDYHQFVADWLVLQDLPNPVVKITRILRSDLEADGVDEVLISASYFTEETGHMVVVGDYSLVLLRKVVGNSVYTIPLVQEIYYGDLPVLEFPATYFLENIFDLNGDGTLEVIISISQWEGSGYSVYELHGINAVEVLELTCGYTMPN